MLNDSPHIPKHLPGDDLSSEELANRPDLIELRIALIPRLKRHSQPQFRFGAIIDHPKRVCKKIADRVYD